MRALTPTFCIIIAAFGLGLHQGLDPQKIHANAIVIDTHNDVVQRMLAGENIAQRTAHGHSDLPRFREGGVDAEVFSIWVPPEKKRPSWFHQAEEQISCVKNFISANPRNTGLALTSADIESLAAKGKFAVILGMEGGHPVGNDTSRIRTFYNQGVRYLSLTWNNSTDWATSAKDETENGTRLSHKGLTSLGKLMIRKMNEIGMIIDVSHSGDSTLADVLSISTRPIIASHSSVWKLCHNRRNLKDDQIRGIARSGGAVFINFGPWFIDSGFAGREKRMKLDAKKTVDSLNRIYRSRGIIGEELTAEALASRYLPIRPSLKSLVDHIDYVARLVGADHVGIGSDFDGIPVTPLGMDDVSCFPNITKELVARGYSESDIRKILGGNFLMILREVQKTEGPVPRKENWPGRNR
jgi:membrane dipeptidase